MKKVNLLYRKEVSLVETKYPFLIHYVFDKEWNKIASLFDLFWDFNLCLGSSYLDNV